MQRHVKWFLDHIRLTELYRGKISLLSPFRRVIRTLLQCPYWPTAYAGVIQLSEHQAAPATAFHGCQLLNYWKITWQNDMGIKERIPEPSPSQMKRNIPLLSVCSAKEINWHYLICVSVFNSSYARWKKEIAENCHKWAKETWSCTKLMHYSATLYCLCCFPTASFIPSGNSVFKISQGFRKAAEAKVGNGTHASGNPAWA